MSRLVLEKITSADGDPEDEERRRQVQQKRKADGISGLSLAEMLKREKATKQKREEERDIRILVDGYYGCDSHLTSVNFSRLLDEVQRIVEKEFQVTNWDRVVWISLSGTWAKAVPLYMMQKGLGKFVHFHLPCLGAKTDPRAGFIFPGGCGRMLKMSMDRMHDRLTLGNRGAAAGAAHPAQLMYSLYKQNQCAVVEHDGWREQGNMARNAATHLIHLPLLGDSDDDDVKNDKKQDYTYGGVAYERFAPTRKYQMNLFHLFHRNDRYGNNHAPIKPGSVLDSATGQTAGGAVGGK